MCNVFLKLSDLCANCHCADDVEAIWVVFNGLNSTELSEEGEDLYWTFYERICYLEDLYNDGRWA